MRYTQENIFYLFMAQASTPRGSSIWPQWEENRLFTVLLGILLAYAIVWVGTQIRLTLLQSTVVGVADRQPATITVNGVGTVSTVPDRGTILLSVRAEGATPAAAQSMASQQANDLLVALSELGVAGEDIQTARIGTREQYDDATPPNRVGFVAEHAITVTVRDNDLAGRILARAAELGVSDISGPNFSVEDPTLAQEAARREAIEKAQAQAIVIASAMHMQLGGITSYNEWSNGPMMYAKEMMLGDAAGAGSMMPVPEINPGTTEITVNVSLNYALY